MTPLPDPDKDALPQPTGWVVKRPQPTRWAVICMYATRNRTSQTLCRLGVPAGYKLVPNLEATEPRTHSLTVIHLSFDIFRIQEESYIVLKRP